MVFVALETVIEAESWCLVFDVYSNEKINLSKIISKLTVENGTMHIYRLFVKEQRITNNLNLSDSTWKGLFKMVSTKHNC